MSSSIISQFAKARVFLRLERSPRVSKSHGVVSSEIVVVVVVLATAAVLELDLDVLRR
jgi:hypothetical protein